MATEHEDTCRAIHDAMCAGATELAEALRAERARLEDEMAREMELLP